MMIVCPRCKAANDSFEERCKACDLPFDATLRSQREGLQEATGYTAVPVAEHGQETLGLSRGGQQTNAADAADTMLARLLGIEVAHVRALADAGIHTLEHIAEAIPEDIGHVLRAWAKVDPGAIVSRARALLDRGSSPQAELHPKRESPRERAHEEPGPAEWWRTT
jgi:rubredoxin